MATRQGPAPDNMAVTPEVETEKQDSRPQDERYKRKIEPRSYIPSERTSTMSYKAPMSEARRLALLNAPKPEPAPSGIANAFRLLTGPVRFLASAFTSTKAPVTTENKVPPQPIVPEKKKSSQQAYRQLRPVKVDMVSNVPKSDNDVIAHKLSKESVGSSIPNVLLEDESERQSINPKANKFEKKELKPSPASVEAKKREALDNIKAALRAREKVLNPDPPKVQTTLLENKRDPSPTQKNHVKITNTNKYAYKIISKPAPEEEEVEEVKPATVRDPSRPKPPPPIRVTSKDGAAGIKVKPKRSSKSPTNRAARWGSPKFKKAPKTVSNEINLESNPIMEIQDVLADNIQKSIPEKAELNPILTNNVLHRNGNPKRVHNIAENVNQSSCIDDNHSNSSIDTNNNNMIISSDKNYSQNYNGAKSMSIDCLSLEEHDELFYSQINFSNNVENTTDTKDPAMGNKNKIALHKAPSPPIRYVMGSSEKKPVSGNISGGGEHTKQLPNIAVTPEDAAPKALSPPPQKASKQTLRSIVTTERAPGSNITKLQSSESAPAGGAGSPDQSPKARKFIKRSAMPQTPRTHGLSRKKSSSPQFSPFQSKIVSPDDVGKSNSRVLYRANPVNDNSFSALASRSNTIEKKIIQNPQKSISGRTDVANIDLAKASEIVKVEELVEIDSSKNKEKGSRSPKSIDHTKYFQMRKPPQATAKKEDKMDSVKNRSPPTPSPVIEKQSIDQSQTSTEAKVENQDQPARPFFPLISSMASSFQKVASEKMKSFMDVEPTIPNSEAGSVIPPDSFDTPAQVEPMIEPSPPETTEKQTSQRWNLLNWYKSPNKETFDNDQTEGKDYISIIDSDEVYEQTPNETSPLDSTDDQTESKWTFLNRHFNIPNEDAFEFDDRLQES